MRHHRLPLLAGLVSLGLALAVASCSVSTSVGSYYVTYRVNGLSGFGTIDSVLYSPGAGKCTTTCNADSSMVKVNNPAATWNTELTIPSGSTVQATVYGAGTAAGTAQFTVIWMTASGTVRGDSVTAGTTAATKFTLALAKRTL